jgi:hypothetical protein
MVRARVVFAFPKVMEARCESGGFTDPALDVGRIDLRFGDEGAEKFDRNMVRNSSGGYPAASRSERVVNTKRDRSSFSLTDVHIRDRSVEKSSVGLRRRGEEAVEARGHSDPGYGRDSEERVIVSGDFPNIEPRAEGSPERGAETFEEEVVWVTGRVTLPFDHIQVSAQKSVGEIRARRGQEELKDTFEPSSLVSASGEIDIEDLVGEPARRGIDGSITAKLSITTQLRVKREIPTPKMNEGGGSIDNEDTARFRVPVTVTYHTVIERREQSTIVQGGKVGFLEEQV